MKKFMTKRVRLTLLYAFVNLQIMLITMGLCVAGVYIFNHYELTMTKEMAAIQVISFANMSVVVSVFVTMFFSRIPLNPIQKLIEAIDKIASGDFSARIKIKGIKLFKELSDSFNHMAEELDGVEVLRSDFINNFSHEFKTPIASVLGFAKMLKQKDLTEAEREEYLDIIISESERLSELSTNVLNLTKLESQSILADKQTVNISEQLRLSIALLDEKSAQKDIHIRFDADEICAPANDGLLKQVWINLIDNAIKFSPQGSDVDVAVEQRNDTVTVSVANHGEKIPEENRERIFNRFYQGDSSHATPGNGLGLAIAHRIVELHNGNIRIARSDDEATVFEVLLPAST